MSLKRILKNLRNPLPDPVREADKFFTLSLNRLFFYQIQELVCIIVDEARTSRKFGLYITPEHFEKEELFFLTMIDLLGGIRRLRGIPREEARKIISEKMWEYFAEEVCFYFEESKRNKEAVLNKYNCHLESVLARLMREIYDVPNQKL